MRRHPTLADRGARATTIVELEWYAKVIVPAHGPKLRGHALAYSRKAVRSRSPGLYSWLGSLSAGGGRSGLGDKVSWKEDCLGAFLV